MQKLNGKDASISELTGRKNLTPNEKLVLYRKTLELLQKFPSNMDNAVLRETNWRVVGAAADLLRDVEKIPENKEMGAYILSRDIQQLIKDRIPLCNESYVGIH